MYNPEHTGPNHELFGPNRHNAPDCPRCKLNAAAPDLLEVLQVIKKIYWMIGSGVHVAGTLPGQIRAIEKKMDKAIAKATE